MLFTWHVGTDSRLLYDCRKCIVANSPICLVTLEMNALIASGMMPGMPPFMDMFKDQSFLQTPSSSRSTHSKSKVCSSCPICTSRRVFATHVGTFTLRVDFAPTRQLFCPCVGLREQLRWADQIGKYLVVALQDCNVFSYALISPMLRRFTVIKVVIIGAE